MAKKLADVDLSAMSMEELEKLKNLIYSRCEQLREEQYAKDRADKLLQKQKDLKSLKDCKVRKQYHKAKEAWDKALASREKMTFTVELLIDYEIDGPDRNLYMTGKCLGVTRPLARKIIDEQLSLFTEDACDTSLKAFFPITTNLAEKLDESKELYITEAAKILQMSPYQLDVDSIEVALQAGEL